MSIIIKDMPFEPVPDAGGMSLLVVLEKSLMEQAAMLYEQSVHGGGFTESAQGHFDWCFSELNRVKMIRAREPFPAEEFKIRFGDGPLRVVHPLPRK